MLRNTLIKFKNWNDQQGIIDTQWKSTDYETLQFTKREHDYAENGMGFVTEKTNFSIYGKNISVFVGNSFEMPDVLQKITALFDLDEIVSNVNMYNPGMILPWHQDSYVTYANNKKLKKIDGIVRVIVFLHDSLPGQQLWIGDRFCFGKAGSWFSWQGSQIHMAANLSMTDRYVLQITGILK